ncbi:thiopeptide-type bacteriocin biosynthesis protein [Nocardiopsis lambiniae]|uniref:Thiopeptide-type bacteriocin biosynthesis protein n=1 Tax=Nocardiopsis lambiniae TaxID=3075539 RepID=A0ABU2M5Y6_9ACTN|nr:thiopeptide-type bacteriocin biosynthesis protein [Nocardiopsis sp. DSM 44743]MDT0328057.1 thiopeptide-type bacteriocin biosynthesis protein [Nocardiopsis sp. DSM 44743]
MTRTWSAVYVHLHRGRENIDAFLLDHVAPAAEAVVAAGDAQAWFFIRYWAGGPHLRVRFLNAAAEAVRGFAEHVRAAAAKTSDDVLDVDPATYYARLPQADPDDWHADGEVVDAVYEPETARYGGPEALEVCEDFFCASTAIAVAVLRSAPRAGQRQAIAADLVSLAFGILGWDDVTAVRQARGYHAAWDFSAEVARGDDRPRVEAERLFHSSPSRWLQRRSLLERLVATEGNSTHHLWTRALGDTVDRLRALHAERPLTNGIDRIVWSLVHMNHNRLGLDIDNERRIAWLASLAYPRWEAREDYFSDGASAPDRAYAEAAKYRTEAIATTQLPRPVPVETERPEAFGAPVAELPPPMPLTAPLGEVLARRASAHGDYGSGLSLAELSSLLGHAAGVSAERADEPGRHRPPRRYPSPGAAYATEVWAVVRDVTGVDPGVYRYRPEGHALVRADGPVPVERLTALSPFLRPSADGMPGMVTASAGAIVFLVGDVGRLRAGYGQRALRLLLQEAGHIAQNLTLCATALGLRSLVVSGFVDDAAHALLHLDGIDRTVMTLIPVGGGAEGPRPSAP